MRLKPSARRTFTNAYGQGEPEMMPSNTPLQTVVDRYLEDAETRLDWKTVGPHRSRLRRWLRYLRSEFEKEIQHQDPKRENPEREETEQRNARREDPEPVLDDFVEPNARRWVDLFMKQGRTCDARNKAIAIRALGTWLAENKYWYVGDRRVPLSLMSALEIPDLPPRGRPIFQEHELETIRDAAGQHRTRPYFMRAVHMLDELGPRAGVEALTLRLDDVIPPQNGSKGKITILRENTKTDHGARNIPLEPAVYKALEDYVEFERPRYRGEDPTKEPLFLTPRGRGYKYRGWTSMRRRFKEWVQRFDPKLRYQPSRNRGTRTYKLRREGYTDTEINQLMGWGPGSRMIARYSGDLPDEHFDTRPNTTGQAHARPRRVSSLRDRVRPGPLAVEDQSPRDQPPSRPSLRRNSRLPSRS